MRRFPIASFVMLLQTIARIQSDLEGWVEDWRPIYSFFRIGRSAPSYPDDVMIGNHAVRDTLQAVMV